MHPDCLLEIEAAIGRKPTKAEAADIEGGILDAMREIARTEPKWAQMTGQQRLQAAAELAHSRALEQAEVSAQRKASNLVAQAREGQRLMDRAAALGGKQAHHDALFERLRQSDDYVAGIRNEYLSGLVDAIEAVEPGVLGLFEDRTKVRDFARAILGERVEDAKLARAAEKYNETMENMRLRANAAGADIGKLDYSYIPQPWDVGKVARGVGGEFARDVLPELDRSRYVNADGTPMTDEQITTMLGDAAMTIGTEGRSKRVPGQRGGGSRASRFDDAHRAIHFKDADAYLRAMDKYGRGSMLEAIAGHVGSMSKTIGLMEEFGANPNSTYRLLKDMAEMADNKAGSRRSFATLDMVWDTLNGTTAQPVSATLAQIGQGVRNFMTAAKLQGVMLSAITDAPLQVVTAKANSIPLGKAAGTIFNGLGREKKSLARSLGIGMDEVAGEMARWHSENIAQGWTKKLATTTMRATLVEGWSNALRRGFGLSLSERLASMRKTDWASLKEWDRVRFETGGVTAQDWKIWQLAEATPFKDTELLTKNGLRDIPVSVLEANGLMQSDVDRATSRLLGYIDQESHTAVLTPDVMTRAAMQQGTRAGTVVGESVRMAMLFKAFAFSIVDKHLRRIQSIPTTQGKMAYSVAMMTTLPLFGAVSLQLKDIATGKDPRDMTTSKFWLAAALQGGGLGIYGDVFYTSLGGSSRGGQPNWTGLAGPVFGSAFDLASLTMGNIGQSAEGKDTNIQAELIRFARGNTPFINLWYLRAAVDHLALHDLQESASPGYLRKMRKRAQRDWGQDYWWQPGEAAPARAPNFEAVAGE